MQNARKNEQEQKNIEQGKRAYSKRLITFDFIVHHKIVGVLFQFTGKNIENSLHVHFYILQ